MKTSGVFLVCVVLSFSLIAVGKTKKAPTSKKAHSDTCAPGQVSLFPEKNVKRFPKLKRLRVLHTKYGCFFCHTTDGRDAVGPSFMGIFGKKVQLESGKWLLRDETYLAKKIRNSASLVLKGNRNVMPIYKDMKDQDLKVWIALIRFLASPKKVKRKKKATSKPASRPAKR